MPPLVGAAIVAGLTELGAGALAGTLATTTILGTSLSTVIGGVLLTGALYGAEMLLQRPRGQQPSFNLPPGPIPFEAQGQAVGGRFYTYGVDRVGGTFCFRESSGQTLGYGIVLNCRPIDAVEGYFIDDELAAMGSGPITQSFIDPLTGIASTRIVDYGPDVVWPSGGLKWTNFYKYIYVPTKGGGGTQTPIVTGAGPVGFIEFHNAADGGVPSTLLKSDFPNLWTDAHRARGLTMIYSRWQAVSITGGREAHYPRLYPVHSTVIRGSRVFDPRDATQSFLDPGTGRYSAYNPTWKYSANPALIIADFLTFPEAFGLAYDDIAWPAFIQAANACDRFVDAFVDALEPFARCHLTWAATEERRDVLNRMLATCDGQLYEAADGKIVLWIGQYEEPAVVLTETDISSLQIEETSGVYAESNYVQVTYVEPRTNFSKNTTVVVTDDASIAQVGERQSTMDLSAVHSFSQAFRLATRAMRRQNTPQKITLVGKARCLLADGQRVISLNCPTYGVVGTYRVLAMSAPSLANISMTLGLITRDMFEDVVPPYDPVNAALPGVVVAAGFTPGTPSIAAAVPSVNGTVGVITAVLVTPTAPGDTSAIAYFRSRPVDPTTHVALGDWTVWDNALGQYSATSPAITGIKGKAQVFEVNVWLVSTQGVPSSVSASVFVALTF